MSTLADLLEACRAELLAPPGDGALVDAAELDALLDAVQRALRGEATPPATPAASADLEALVRAQQTFLTRVLERARARSVAPSLDELERLAACVAAATIRATVELGRRASAREQAVHAEAARAREGEQDRFRRVVEASRAGTWEIALPAWKTTEDEQHRILVGAPTRGALEFEARLTTLVHADDRARVQRAFVDAARGEHGGLLRVEFRVGPPEAPRWIEIRGQAVFDATGTPTRIVGTSLDVTERKQIEAEREELLAREQAARQKAERLAADLLASERRRRQIADAAGVGAWEWDLASDHVEIDPHFAELLGLPFAPRVPSNVITDRVCAQDLPHVEQAVSAALAGENGGRYLVEFRARMPDGSLRWVSRANALFDERGAAVRIAGYAVDVGERKEAERLREQAQKDAALAQATLLETIADQAVFGVAILSGPELRFDLANAGYRALVGDRDVAGKPFLVALPELAGQGADELILEVMRSGKSMTFREQPYHLDVTGTGKVEPRYFNFVWQAIRRPGEEASSVLVLTHDVTESVTARENAQLLREQAEQANRLKDEFLATVSHELRTPLNAMLGWVQMLRGGQVAAQRVPRALETIERNARAQKQLIDDILDVARITSGKMTLEVATVALGPIVELAVESSRVLAESRGVELHVALADVTVRGDAARLQQVAWNLLTNALKFTPSGGRVDVSLAAADGGVELVVADTGKGIPADFLPFVFDRFRQAEGLAARAHGGLGLGLSIVKYLVELHGGEVTARSEGPGRGATFRVRLPVDGAAHAHAWPAEAPPSPPSPAALRGVKVLVVDDATDTLELHVAILERRGATVVAATSASDALARIESFVPDLVLSDIGMPGEDGYSLLRKLRERAAPDRKIMAVAITAFARPQDRAKALEAGFDDFATKPIAPAELARLVARLGRANAR